ncbi:uncharacterized protein LOC117530597 [Thalassophryne amazonica]|uniref:uncharacterized protein LOC117530597 n=1 Tax=Thalassophryne amazonica TaxID=390379 RepID=UPI001470E62C|nr:uncharacterized protein LOC117530597 [Thalassophryne amazonica]
MTAVYHTSANWLHLPQDYCGGHRQSPIDIVSQSAKKDNQLKNFTYTHFDDKNVIDYIINTGHTDAHCQQEEGFITDTGISGADGLAVLGFLIDVKTTFVLVIYTFCTHSFAVKCVLKENTVEISDGGLQYDYSVLQLHFHWGNILNNSMGSELTVDSKRFPMEMHIVSKRKDLSLTQALVEPDGLAVLGFLIDVKTSTKSEHTNSSHDEEQTQTTAEWHPWKNLTNYLPHISDTGCKVKAVGGLSLNDLLGDVNLAVYYHYKGSLTTPSCNEAVVWSVFKDSIKIDQSLIEMFPMYAGYQDVYRPMQSLHTRNVYISAASSPSESVTMLMLLACLYGLTVETKWQMLALGAWNITSLWGKELELVREVECYQLDLVGLASTHSLGSGTILFDKGWTLFFSEVAQEGGGFERSAHKHKNQEDERAQLLKTTTGVLKMKQVILAVLAACALIHSAHCDSAEDWCYHLPSCNDSTWPIRNASHCNGTRQSPINIVTANATVDSSLTAFTFYNFSSTSALKKIENTGKTIKVVFNSGVAVSGGGLPTKYNSLQFHLHWGNGTEHPGSEHTVNGKRYAMELHIVSMSDAFTNTSDAIKNSTGLAALGFFIEAKSTSETDLPVSWKNLSSYLASISLKGQSATIQHEISLNDLLSGVDLTQYYRYLGSLTTPDCNEAVIWTVFKEPIKVSRNLINIFSTLHINTTNSSALMIDVYRRIQPWQMVTTTANQSSGGPASTCYSVGLMVLGLALCWY